MRRSHGGRAVLVLLIVAWNVLPFIPVWPGYSGGGDSWFEDWLGPFLFLNAAFWLIAVVLWLTGSHRPRRRRAMIAELPVFAQALLFLGGGWWGALIAVVLRGVDGALLYLVDPRARSTSRVSAALVDSAAERLGGVEQEPWPIRAFENTRVRAIVIVTAVLLAAGSAYYHLVVVPELSSDRYELWVAGSENDLRISVDRDDSLVHITGIPSRTPDLVVANRAVYLPTDAFSGGSSADVDWIEIPLAELDPRYSALTADRIGAAISRDVRQCDAPSVDAIDVIGLLLPSASPRSDGFSICERYVGLVADVGSDVFVSVSRVRPDETAKLVSERSVSYLDVSDPDAVLARLELNQ